MDDHLLIKQMAENQKNAFDLFYEKYHRYIFQIAYNIIKNRLEAEDICHDVLIEIYQKANQYSTDRGSVKAWIAIRTRSRALDRLRKKTELLANKMEDILTKVSPAADQYVIENMEKEVLQRALNRLPLEQRQAIYYMYFDQFTQKEIALELGRPLGSVKSSVRYGLQNLRKQKSLLRWISSSGGDK
ncbi:RNA polymerase sigma-70 factor, ECF subfamily [Gracilibacillus ureilyticus]|uniref:RNA polymerase sigma-70 factor, ECF subfamily n=1 Tax=Gracilibacillus ureilyticus TaxID=531814 RepID=A0A1H9QAV0_9BACI|nr:sigma-70 family RNA polymerase sigma factor [Gracilibacillus ureilyticus]SER57574.1 RNA polymerase sigma-70 factor, ECF subfamily [Gracilibacillus ureilyticus]